MLASNVIFPWQVFHYHLQSSFSKLYLSATYMFYSVFCSIKISFKPNLIHMSYGIVSHLTFLLIILSYKKIHPHILPHALSHKYDAHDMF